MKHWEELEIFKLAIKNATDHIIITDPNATILYANDAVGHVTGYSPKEVIGKRPSLWGKQMPPAFYTNFWKRIKVEKKDYIGEIKNRRKNGEHYDAEIKVAPVLDSHGKVIFFVGIERDITKLKQIERAKDEIISLAAHQLKNGPATVKIYADSLLDGIAGKLGKKQEHYIEEIQIANKMNIDLIDSLLNVTRLELGTFKSDIELVNIEDIIKNVLRQQAHRIIKKDLNVIEKYERGAKNFSVSRQSLEVVLHNLISNACKYTPKNGKINITVKFKKSGKTKKIFIEIADTGCGIPKEAQSKIFAKMYRAENVKTSEPDGSGLGLYMVKLALKDLKASIEFTSTEGRGTRFIITLPIKLST